MRQRSMNSSRDFHIRGRRALHLGGISWRMLALYECADIGYHCFALDSHQRISGAIRNDAAQLRVDMVTLAEELRKRKELEGIGGVSYLASLTEGLPRKLSIAQYVRIVRKSGFSERQ